MQCPKAVLFDLDDTLAESFQAPTSEMLGLLKQLLDYRPVAILTAASFQRMRDQFLDQLTDSPFAGRLYLFANVATECYTWQDGWNQEYSFSFTPEEHSTIKSAVHQSLEETGVELHPQYAPKFFERGGKVAYAMIGIDAPKEVKDSWDADKSKRTLLKASLDKKLLNSEIAIGGTTTIDITPKGVDKSYGVKWMSEHLHIPPSDMIFIGDALFPGGNDAVVIPTGIATHAVTGPDDTLKLIRDLLKSCAAA